MVNAKMFLVSQIDQSIIRSPSKDYRFTQGTSSSSALNATSAKITFINFNFTEKG